MSWSNKCYNISRCFLWLDVSSNNMQFIVHMLQRAIQRVIGDTAISGTLFLGDIKYHLTMPSRSGT